jgi:4-hydroxy-3-polyprenylbenzoate decarboxylase
LKLVIAITGASGVVYGIRALEVLKALKVETHLIMSEWG